MIFEGFKLTAMGMGIVFIFLILVVLSINLSSFLLRSVTEKEIKAQEEEARKSSKKGRSGSADDSKITAVISAAIAMFRNRN